MNSDEYWKMLVERVYHQQEELVGIEETYYRLSCIYGETMVDGIQSYFERRVQEYQKDMTTLVDHGFKPVADEYANAKSIMFGQNDLTPESVDEFYDRMCEDEDLDNRIDQQLGPVYDRLIEQLEDLNEYIYQFGIKHQLYSE
ncbi:hypothetical protein Enr10x_19600 [Gimesia panareensis]|uniref:DUF4375 domain-containing protein n=1 Tax=Gimesia panareensis TaxID=2527978 RepID=A0A517Q4U5_9PLAN|nr:hypothetical protein [Gimesia panareensis]QDT26650.1 hypothetical protein Enr10x_19600 [Gimesia panareensis]